MFLVIHPSTIVLGAILIYCSSNAVALVFVIEIPLVLGLASFYSYQFLPFLQLALLHEVIEVRQQPLMDPLRHFKGILVQVFGISNYLGHILA